MGKQNISNTVIFKDVEEILTKKVKPIGNGAHVPIPKKHIGKIVKIIILKEANI